MATRMCPQCGSQYVASVRRCIDCDVVLVDEPKGAASEGDGGPASSTPLGDGDQVAYELEGWSNQLKVTLEGMLDGAGIRRVWEAGALVVPASDEAQVDALVATVEGADEAALAEDVDQVAFEIEGLTPEELVDLDARLIAAQIAHAWEEGGALLVAADDEDVVAEMIDDVLAAGTAPEGEADGLATHEALTELYVVVDKAIKDPTDRKLVRRYGAAAARLDAAAVPYGLSASAWQSLVEEIAALGRTLAGDEDEDEVGEGAGKATEGTEPEGRSDSDQPAVEGAEAPTDDHEEPTARDRLVARIRSLRERLQEVV